MEEVSSPYELACNVGLLVAYCVALGNSLRVQYVYFNKDRFLQMMQYLVSVFYACEGDFRQSY